MRTNTSAWLVMGIALGSASARSLGHGMIPQNTPVDRIITNIEAQLKDKPNDAELHYRLGRTHGLAFELKSDTVSAWNRGDPTEIAEKCWQWPSDHKGTPKDDELRAHLSEALRHLGRALELDPGPARYHMALASVLESGLPLAGKIDAWPHPPASGAAEHINEYLRREVESAERDPDKIKDVLSSLRSSFKTDGGFTVRDVVAATLLKHLSDSDQQRARGAREILVQDWKAQIGEEYFTALCFALPHDSELRQKPLWGSMDCWIAYDAAKSFQRIAGGDWGKDTAPIRKATAKTVVSSFENLPRPNGITPIIFPVDGPSPLATLVSADARTTFDLDGSGRQATWPWLNSHAGILVWDPAHEGKITSGRQLFGSVSWWVFFDNGYQALAALDDNHDGQLSGDELKGIAVWIDRNGNGVSDPGEVLPVEKLGVRSISVQTTGTHDGCPSNRQGIEMRDGRILPTYDWIAQPVAAEKLSIKAK